MIGCILFSVLKYCFDKIRLSACHSCPQCLYVLCGACNRMVRHYKRKTNRASYPQEAMSSAVNDVRQRKLNAYKASQVYGVPRSSIVKRLKQPEGYQPLSLGRFKPVFDVAFEAELVMHAVGMQQRFYGLTLLDLRSIAYELAEANGLDHPFSHEDKRAGISWVQNFMRRYPELTLHRPEATSMSRLTGFNRVQVGKFFELLRYEMSTKKYTASQIYNLDETGITTVQDPGRIIARKGAKQVGKVVSAERGSTTTVVCAMSADGVFVPPVFLFKRKLMNDRLMTNSPPGALGIPSRTGWMDSDLFLVYFRHFIAYVKPSEANPILVIMDGHQSHKSLALVEMARSNFVTVLTLPPHTSHRMQPLDVSFFSALKSGYNRQMDNWMVKNPGKRVTDYDLCTIFTPAYNRVASAEKAVNGFAASGIFPFNPDVFNDDDYAPSSVTEQIDPAMRSEGQQGLDPRPVFTQQKKSSVQVSTQAKKRQPVSSPAASSRRISVNEVSPYPRVTQSNPRKRKAESSNVLTSTPNKRRLEESEKKKKETAAKKQERTIVSPRSPETRRSKSAKPTVPVRRRLLPTGIKKPLPPCARPPLPRPPTWLKHRISGTTSLILNYTRVLCFHSFHTHHKSVREYYSDFCTKHIGLTTLS